MIKEIPSFLLESKRQPGFPLLTFKMMQIKIRGLRKEYFTEGVEESKIKINYAIWSQQIQLHKRDDTLPGSASLGEAGTQTP